MEVRTLEDAAAFVGRVGIAVVHPKADLVLPSLWEAVAANAALEWAVRDEAGTFVSFTPEFARVWRWKDKLPERRLACGGKHLGHVVVLVAPSLLSSLYALTGRAGEPDDFRGAELSELQREIAEAVLENGPCTGPELRRLLGSGDRRRIATAVETLQRLLVLTSAGVEEQEQGWPAIRFDLLARRWRVRLRRLPPVAEARRRLAGAVLASAGEVSAADLAAAVGWQLAESADALEDLAARGRAATHDENGIAIWSSTAS